MFVYPVTFFEDRPYRTDPKLCFVVMPFSLKWSSRVYRVIKSVIQKAGFKCIRADDVRGKIVARDIWQQLNEAAFVIADLTGANPNVYYELGIAHTLGKEVIPLLQQGGQIPFDQRAFRILFYEDNLDGYAVLKRELPNWIRDLSFSSSPQMLIKTGAVQQFNDWRKVNSNLALVGEDFTGLTLVGMNFTNARLSETCLDQAAMDQADFSGAILIRAQMRKASLRKTNLIGANLSEADLTGANLTEADLSGAIILRPKLHNAKLTNANVSGLTIDQASYKKFSGVFAVARNRSKIIVEK